MAWQNSFFKSRLPKHKKQCVKFQTSVSLYLGLNGNIAIWSISPTWNYIFFLRYELQRNGLKKLILHGPIAET